MKLRHLFAAIGIAFLTIATSCSSSKEISYFQDLSGGIQLPATVPTSITFEPNDKLSIVVSTGDSRLNSLFNLPVPRYSVGTSAANTSGVMQQSSYDMVASYTINSSGDIDFPVLGRLHIAGMNREQVAEYVRRELISRDLVKDPVVTVDYLNLCVTVMGEVTRPGRYAIDRDDYSLLDALSAAGDLTIYGKRNNVRVIRMENGMQKVYEVNLLDGKSLAQSPVYHMQQNDVVYIEPNATRARQSTPNGNNILTPTFWISIASFLTTIAVLIIK